MTNKQFGFITAIIAILLILVIGFSLVITLYFIPTSNVDNDLPNLTPQEQTIDKESSPIDNASNNKTTDEKLLPIDDSSNEVVETVPPIEKIDTSKIISISQVETFEPNSANGVSVAVHWTNTSDKVIKYAYFTIQAYNAVDDPVECTISHNSSITGIFTGPFNPGASDKSYWEAVWYNSSIVRSVITQIEIEYMDGTSIILNGKDIPIGITPNGTTTITKSLSGSLDEYVLPYSDTQYLAYSDLVALSDYELRLARNEIFARYGYIFKSQELLNYFNTTSWYVPSISVENFNSSVFNEYEKYNVEFIKNFE